LQFNNNSARPLPLDGLCGGKTIVHNVPNLDEASQPLALAWADTLARTPAAAATLLAGLSAESPPGLAHHLYDLLLEDPRASRFLPQD